ncbi:hypothetical protein A9Q98_01625 [Thalassotalea sp. 42_200_T64]|nr:hypothetical protein A9Q98_01625 [Thalassotalea sp. 42_200_T64]
MLLAKVKAFIRQPFLLVTLMVCVSISPFSAANQGTALGLDLSEGKPLWEAGLFSTAFRGPIYPAAKDYQNKLLAVPFFIYRGEKIRIGDESLIKAIAVEKETFKLDVSLGAAFNANSEDSKIRQGMPDLDFMFEIGPQASFLMADSEHSETWLNLQLRSVFSTDFSAVKQRGYVFQPEVSYKRHDFIVADNTLFLAIAPTFASAKTHQYFYDVEQAYVNEEREFYQASGGYLGSKVTIANRYSVNKRLMMFFGVQLGVWSGAKNEASPLFQQDFTYTLALGLKWSLFSSNTLVD